VKRAPETRYLLGANVEILHPPQCDSVAKLLNISLSGCYISTPDVVAEHARIRIVFRTGPFKANLWGVVIRRDDGGLGIQFTNGATVEDWKALQGLIKHLASAGPMQAQATSAGG
jgi:hypothetical protein